MFRRKKIKKQPINVDADLKAIKSFLQEIGSDVENIFYLCKQMERLRQKDLTNAPEETRRKNLEEQVKLWDKMLTIYEFFDEDVDVNSERVKNIAKDLRKKTKTVEIDEKLKRAMNTEPRWTFNW